MSEETILVKIVVVRKDAQLTRLYRHLMETPLAEVRSVGMWHVLRVLRRVTHMCVASESLAEHVGSVPCWMEARQGPRTVLGRTLWGAAVRMAGLRGAGGEDGILSVALNAHFQVDGPAGWHFWVAKCQEHVEEGQMPSQEEGGHSAGGTLAIATFLGIKTLVEPAGHNVQRSCSCSGQAQSICGIFLGHPREAVLERAQTPGPMRTVEAMLASWIG